MVFQYLAYSADQRLVQGQIEAASEALAEEGLAKGGYRVLTLKPVRARLSLEALFPSFFTVKTRQVVQFLNYLATLLECGMPLMPALQSLEEAETNRAFKKVISAVIADLSGGSSFSEALLQHPQAFPPLYQQLIQARERAGNLDAVLRQAATQLEKKDVLAKKLGQAMVYPAMVSVMGVGVVVVLVTIALPPIIDMLKDIGVSLPLPTRLLLGIVDLFKFHLLELLLVGGMAITGGILGLRRPAGRRWRDRLLLRAPLIGPINKAVELSRLTRTMSLLLETGIPLPEVMGLSAQTAGNGELKRALVQVREDATQGKGLYGPMVRTGMFPPLLTNIVRVGEQAGTLSTALSTLANAYEREAEERVGKLTQMLEPVMTLGIALLVGFIALSVIMPVYRMMGSMG